MAVVTCLPSGVNNANSIIAKVEADGNILCIKVAAPTPVTDPEQFLMFCKHDPVTAVAPEFRVRAFHKALSDKRESRNDAVWWQFDCELDFPCIEDIPIIKTINLDGCIYLYVELFAKVKHQYMGDNGRLSCEIVHMSTKL